MSHLKALFAFAIASFVFILGLNSLSDNLAPQLEEAHIAIDSTKHTLCLKKGLKQDQISKFLIDKGYISDKADANLIGNRIEKYLNANTRFPNLGALMKDPMKIHADSAINFGGSGFKKRIEDEYSILGISYLPSTINTGNVYIETGIDSSRLGTINVKINNAKGEKLPLADIPVRIKRYFEKTDSIPATLLPHEYIMGGASNEDTIGMVMGYATTDSLGKASFKVEKGKRYSLVPVKKGSQFGRERGTVDGPLGSVLNVSFSQKPHVVTLLSPQTFSNIKLDRSLVVRTPAEFKESLTNMGILFIICWGVFLLITFYIDNRLKTHTDYLLIITLMVISGIGLLASYGIWNPLSDTLYGDIMSNGLIVGLIAMLGVILINYAKLDARLTGSKIWIFRNYGWMSLIGAMGLLVMLYLFGSGPEGSDAKVNLFGFQPSELARVLIVIFMAWFFARKATLIQDFSQRLTAQTFKRQLAIVSSILAGMIILMGIYLKLSDMGPALVVLVSFILIYSMARRDFAQLLFGLISFIIIMMAARWLHNATSTLLLAAGIWFAAWGVLCWKKRQIYESAIFLNVVIVIFSLAGPILKNIGQDGLAARLTNRTDMAWEGVWNNEVLGGDQVVQGIWSLATGGMSGLGLGNGSPSIVPAGHTDMIFTTIGEMLGLIGLILVVLCFFVLIHRTLLIGRRAGFPFPFYLATGIGIVTGIQFLVIVAGSIGLLPLTGVTLPFLSYGRVSLIISLVSFGFVISISRLRANEIQRKYTNSFNGSVAACSALFLLIGAILLATAAKYQIFSRGETLIRPAFVTNTQGARIVEYNPRIGLVLRKLHAGNIYDRNGLLLATSSRDELVKAKDDLNQAGISSTMYNNEFNKRKRRYYPFGDHTLFMLGDYNTLKVFGYTDDNPTGYLAEARHRNELRGLDIPSYKKNLTAHKYKENRFVDTVAREFNPRLYDYSVLLDQGFLDYGIERNPVIEAHNARRENRDMKLTLDAALQMKLQNALASAISNDGVLKNSNLLRASVVVLDAKNGDLLCSANYPLPDQDSIFMLNSRKIYGDVPFEKLPDHLPITERDLGLTFQSMPGSTAKVMSAMSGFMNMGTDASKVTYKVHPDEAIERGEPFANGQHDITVGEAIELSSNNYFVNLVHDKDLYSQLDSIYYNVGIRVYPDTTYIMGIKKDDRNITPYYFTLDEFNKKNEFDNLLTTLGSTAKAKYDWYIQQRNEGKYRPMNFGETQAAWGQGPILATPLNMARVASIVANDGEFTPTRYILEKGNEKLPVKPSKEIISSSSAGLLKSYMQKESDKHRRYGKKLPSTNDNNRMGGKTGTPERNVPQHLRKGIYKNDKGRANDAWYVFFIESETQNAPLAIAVRFERTGAKGIGSGKAVQYVADVIIPTLNEAGYKVK